MDYKVYDIKSLSEAIFEIDPNNGNGLYNLFTPSFVWGANYKFNTYVVEEFEEGRIDLVMDGMYADDGLDHFGDIDIILYLNGIDNPLNILAGSELIYPSGELLDAYRYKEFGQAVNDTDIKNRLSVPNKTTRVDKNRQKFVDNDYSLSPTISSNNTPPVKVTSDKIIVGGLK